MNDDNAIGNGRASSLAEAGAMLSRSTTASRVGSASAWKMPARAGSAGKCLGMHLTIRDRNS